MGFRIGRKFAQHVYPEAPAFRAGPLSVVGFNATQISIFDTTETTIATTSASLPFDGNIDATVQISFEIAIAAV